MSRRKLSASFSIALMWGLTLVTALIHEASATGTEPGRVGCIEVADSPRGVQPSRIAVQADP